MYLCGWSRDIGVMWLLRILVEIGVAMGVLVFEVLVEWALEWLEKGFLSHRREAGRHLSPKMMAWCLSEKCFQLERWKE